MQLFRNFPIFARKNIVMDTTPGCRDYNSNSEGIHGEESWNMDGTGTKTCCKIHSYNFPNGKIIVAQ